LGIQPWATRPRTQNNSKTVLPRSDHLIADCVTTPAGYFPSISANPTTQ
jgi:hypothetical protein